MVFNCSSVQNIQTVWTNKTYNSCVFKCILVPKPRWTPKVGFYLQCTTLTTCLEPLKISNFYKKHHYISLGAHRHFFIFLQHLEVHSMIIIIVRRTPLAWKALKSMWPLINIYLYYTEEIKEIRQLLQWKRLCTMLWKTAIISSEVLTKSVFTGSWFCHIFSTPLHLIMLESFNKPKETEFDRNK